MQILSQLGSQRCSSVMLAYVLHLPSSRLSEFLKHPKRIKMYSEIVSISRRIGGSDKKINLNSTEKVPWGALNTSSGSTLISIKRQLESLKDFLKDQQILKAKSRLRPFLTGIHCLSSGKLYALWNKNNCDDVFWCFLYARHSSSCFVCTALLTHEVSDVIVVLLTTTKTEQEMK